MQTKLTREEILEVPCIRCDSKVGNVCKSVGDSGFVLIGFHKERIELREKMPSLPPELDATDKAVITYYAYVLLCDSVAANSLKMFGKEMSSVEVQRYFASEAIKAAKKDGLIK